MFAKIEDFFLNQYLGKALVKGGVVIASALASSKVGATLGITPVQATAALSAVLQLMVSAYQHLTGKNVPLAVQAAAGVPVPNA